MTANTTAIDAATFLEAAARAGLLDPSQVKELAKRSERRQLPPSQVCMEAGLLTSVQVEAIEGLVAAESIAEGYKVEGLLGYGGVGIVYRARQPSLDREVALKTICTTRLEQSAGNGQMVVARFRQEARSIARLKHPNIVTAYEFGTKDSRVYLAMELVEGVDLGTHIDQSGKVDEFTTWNIARQVVAGLANALEAGIVHRDIKPANLLLTDPPAGSLLPPGIPLVKITDFGLARLHGRVADEDETRLTQAGTMMGTPYYVAPEQLENPEVGFEADVYALGATVYNMLLGHPPWEGTSLIKVMTAKMSGNRAPLENLPEQLSSASRELLCQMMAQSPGERPHSYQDLLERIDQLLSGEAAPAQGRVKSSVIPKQNLRAAEEVTPTLEFDLNQPKRWQKQVLVKAAIGLAALVAAFVLAAVLFGEKSPPTPAFVVKEDIGSSRSLYSGRSIQGWQGVARAADQSEYAGMMQVLGKARRSIAAELQAFEEPAHFRLGMRVVVENGDVLEIWFEQGEDGETKVVRLSDGRLTVGHRRGDQGGFIADSEPVEIVSSQISPHPVIHLDRDQDYWLVRQSVPGEPPPARLLAWARIDGDPPAEILFKSEGDTVYIGEIELVELETSR